MARVARIDGQDFKRREPWGVFALSAITFGIYFLVWYYKVNDEARRYLRDDSIRPGLSVVAIFIPIVAWVSIWRTGERIVRIQGRAATVERLSPGVALLLSFLNILHDRACLVDRCRNHCPGQAATGRAVHGHL